MRTIMGLAGCKKADSAAADTIAVRVIEGETGRLLIAVGDKTASLDLEEAACLVECINTTVKRLEGTK